MSPCRLERSTLKVACIVRTELRSQRLSNFNVPPYPSVFADVKASRHASISFACIYLADTGRMKHRPFFVRIVKCSSHGNQPVLVDYVFQVGRGAMLKQSHGSMKPANCIYVCAKAGKANALSPGLCWNRKGALHCRPWISFSSSISRPINRSKRVVNVFSKLDMRPSRDVMRLFSPRNNNPFISIPISTTKLGTPIAK